MAVVEEAAPVPVAVDVAGPVRTQLLRVVEGALGWPVVDVDDEVLPPRCVLVDAARAGAHVGARVPLVLVVAPEDEPAQAARAGAVASRVLDGVPDAAALARCVAGLDHALPRGRTPWCTVGAAAGGVGATTVAAALAGLRAWRHGPTLLATSGRSHQPGAPLVATGDLASPAVWAAAVPAVGVTELRVARLRDGQLPPDAGPVPLVADLGTGVTGADVLVVRPDRAGLEAVAAGTGAVVAVGRGPVDLAALRRAAEDRPLVSCPWSARVAAAAMHGRLPADLPGTWLRPLAPLVAAHVARAAA